MSQLLLEERVGVVEREQARQGEKIDQLGRQVGDVATGVKQLLERDARRPEPIGLKAVGGAAAALASIALAVWWMIEHAPAVMDLQRRIARLDDPDIGRVTRLEREAGWSTKVIVRP